jgi:hypothetical protein
VSTLPVVSASATNSASAAGAWTATLPGVCPREVDDVWRTWQVERFAACDRHDLCDRWHRQPAASRAVLEKPLLAGGS